MNHNEESLRDTTIDNSPETNNELVSDVLASAMKPKRKIGFALLSPELRRKLGSQGGKRAHELGLAHQFDHQLAVAAGRKGGQAYAANQVKLKAEKVI